MKNTIKILAVVVMVISVVSCKKDSKPNYQFMPNMYESVGYEPYGEYSVFPGDQEAMLPAKGSIPRGWKPYDLEDSNDGYRFAKDSLKNPIRYTKENLETGKGLYTIYCSICHGDKGDGKGTLVKREKILGVPSYDDIGRAITEGSIYHVMYYGINTMGSYASQTNEHERWQIVQYVQKLKADLEGVTSRIDSETEVVKVVDVEETTEHHDLTKEHSEAH